MGNLLSRDAILGASDIKTEDVPVPEWGGTVRVKGLTAGQRDAFEMAITGHDNPKSGSNPQRNLNNIRARLLSLSIVDDEGKTVFSKADIEALGKKSASAIDRVYEAAARLSGLSEGDVDELAGNSEADQIEGSPSA